MKKLLIAIIAGIFAIQMVACAENGTPVETTVETTVATTTIETTETTEATQENVEAPQGGPSSDAPTPKIAIYGGGSYLNTSNSPDLVTAEMVGEKIGDTAGYIDFLSGNFDDSLFTTDLANSISPEAVFYKMNGYSEDFRILVEDNGVYYILEKNADVLTENASASEFLKIADYKESVSGAVINSISGVTEYKTLSSEEAVALIDVFAKTTSATLTNEDYEEIAASQSAGKAYQLSVEFSDGTATSFVVIPELNLVSIAQTYFTLDSLNEELAFAFEGLPQGNDGIVQ